MRAELLTEMTFDEAKKLIDSFIDRASDQNDELSVETSFELLLTKATQTIVSNSDNPSPTQDSTGNG